MPRVTSVKSARQDQGRCIKCPREIKKGDPYKWYAFMVGGRGGPKRKHCQYCPVKPADLTNSDYLKGAYGIEESIDKIPGDVDSVGAAQEIPDQLREIAQEIRDLGEEQQGKLDNMPEGLQQGDTGQLIQSRIDACEEMATQFDEKADTIETAANSLVDGSDAEARRTFMDDADLVQESGESADDFDERVDSEIAAANEDHFTEINSNLEFDINWGD